MLHLKLLATRALGRAMPSLHRDASSLVLLENQDWITDKMASVWPSPLVTRCEGSACIVYCILQCNRKITILVFIVSKRLAELLVCKHHFVILAIAWKECARTSLKEPLRLLSAP